MLSRKCLLLFIAAATSVEGFSTAFTNSDGITTFKSKSTTFGLNSLAASAEETSMTGESNADKTVRTEDDLSKIAYVVNLSYETPGFKLRELFNEYGEVEKVFIPKDRRTGRPKGMAFVTLASEEQRNNAIEKLNEIELDGRTIYVDKAKPRSEKQGAVTERQDPTSTKLYVGNISYETTKEDLETFFAQYGTVAEVYLPVDRETGGPRGFSFVTMKNEDAQKAIEAADGIELAGRTIEVKESLPRGQKAPPRQNTSRQSNETKIYVGNLSFDTEEDTIRALFEEFGELIDLYIPVDRYSGRPRGFAFVTMGKENASRAIAAIDGVEVDERIVRVNEAQPKGYSPAFSNDWGEEGEWEQNE